MDVVENRAANTARAVRAAPVRLSIARRTIQQGQFLLAHKGPHSNSEISRVGYEKFRLHSNDCSKAMAVARLYGDRPELIDRLSQNALFTLVMPSMPLAARRAIEERLAAGERVTANAMLLTRRRFANGTHNVKAGPLRAAEHEKSLKMAVSTRGL